MFKYDTQVAKSMNDAAALKGLDLDIKQYDEVHTKCRKDLCRRPSVVEEGEPSHRRQSRSTEPSFDFKNCCIYCGLAKSKTPGRALSYVRKREQICFVQTLVKQNSIQRAVDKRGSDDDWALKVKD